MSGSPAIEQSVGIQSLWLISSLLTVPGLILSGPANQTGHAEGAFPVGILLAAEPRHCSVWPRIHVRPVVARVDNDGVVRDAHVVEGFEQRADGIVVLDHAVDVLAIAMRIAPPMILTNMRSQVHAGAVEPAEEWLARRVLPLHVIDSCG